MESRTGGGARAPRLDAAARREQIIAAAVACFSLGGPERWTLRQVSRQAGVAPSLITHFFGSWSGLLAAVQGSVVEGLESGLVAASTRPGLGAEERLELWIGFCLPDGFRDDGAGGACLAFQAMARQDPTLRERLCQTLAVVRSTLGPILEGVAADRGVRVDAAALADTAACMVVGLRFELSVDPGTLPAGARERLRAFVEASLRAGAAEPASGCSADPLQPAPLGDEESDGAGDALN